MPTQIQFRRGTTAQNDAFLGANGELTIDTQLHTIRVHDGIIVGGHIVRGAAVKLGELLDVDEGLFPANGAVLTYISAEDKYQVLPLNVSDTVISNTIIEQSNLDGGGF